MFNIAKYIVLDIYRYIKLKKWKQYKNTGIYIIGGGFGCGKSLYATRMAVSLLKRYDNIVIYSNYHLNNVPYVPFKYFEQLNDRIPDKHIIYLIDEVGSIFNSRNYSKNTQITDTQVLMTLNQLRHQGKSMYLMSQRFHMVDKIFRQVCTSYIEIYHIWRFYFYNIFSGYDMEYSNSPQPLNSGHFFATDKDYALYDTCADITTFDEYNPMQIIHTINSDDNTRFETKKPRLKKRLSVR